MKRPAQPSTIEPLHPRSQRQSSAESTLQPRVQSRLLRVFVLQLALISLVTIAGILAASLVAERILVNEALEGEADYFWSRRAENPGFGLPDTLNLQSWFSGAGMASTAPLNIRELPAGQHSVDVNGDERIVYVSERDGERLYLLFQAETVSTLAFYFGVVPLTLVLLMMYSLAFLTYWLSKRAVSPIAKLADVIERFDFNARDASELDLDELPGPRDSETVVLAQALDHFVQRSKQSIERERNFTRYASHELRTPIAVIQGSVASLDLLKLDGAPGRAVARIARSSKHMGQLIESLLLLARDRGAFDESRDPAEVVNVGDLVEQLIDEVQNMDSREDLLIKQTIASPLRVLAPATAVSVVLGNLIRNAWKYTDRGEIVVTVGDGYVSVRDSGRGLSELEQRRIFEPFFRIHPEIDATVHSGNGRSEKGQHRVHEGLGLGLAIVEHFCVNYGWQLHVSSAPGKGSCFTVRFTDPAADPR